MKALKAGAVAGSGAATERAEGLARSGRCSMVGGRCMVTVDGGPMGQLRIEVPAFLCGKPGHGVPARGSPYRGSRRARFRSVGGGPWAVVGLDRRGVERYRVSGYGDEDEARASLEFHPRGTGLTYAIRIDEDREGE